VKDYEQQTRARLNGELTALQAATLDRLPDHWRCITRWTSGELALRSGRTGALVRLRSDGKLVPIAKATTQP
jgi:hypothetical protein